MNNTTSLFNTTAIMPIYVNNSGILSKNMTNRSSISYANKKYRSYICLTFFGFVYAYNYYITH
jgi:hypothetical protein